MGRVKEKENYGKIEKSEVSEASAKVEKIDADKTEVEAKVGEIAEGVKAAVDIAESVEDGAESGEGFSEDKGNKKGDSDVKKSSQQTQQDLKAHVHAVVSSKKMKKQITVAIRKEIRKEERKVLLAYVGVKNYSPHKLAEMMARIRSLKDLLSNLLDATKEILTGLYLKWVRKEG